MLLQFKGNIHSTLLILDTQMTFPIVLTLQLCLLWNPHAYIHMTAQSISNYVTTTLWFLILIPDIIQGKIMLFSDVIPINHLFLSYKFHEAYTSSMPFLLLSTTCSASWSFPINVEDNLNIFLRLGFLHNILGWIILCCRKLSSAL